MPPGDAVPLGSEVEVDVPVDVDGEREAPGVAVGMLVLGVLPDPLEPDEDVDGDEEGIEGEPDEPPPALGMPPEEPPDDLHPATARALATAKARIARLLKVVGLIGRPATWMTAARDPASVGLAS